MESECKSPEENNPVLQGKNISICRLNLKTLCRCSRRVGKGKEAGRLISLSGVCCVSIKTSLPFNIIKGHPIRKKHPHPLKGRNPTALASLVNWNFLSFLKQGTHLAAPSLPLLPFCTAWRSKPLASLAYEPARKVDVWGSAAVLAADVELSRWYFFMPKCFHQLADTCSYQVFSFSSFLCSW